MVAFSSFISSIDPKKIKKVMTDVEWVNYMQEELHQIERSKV